MSNHLKRSEYPLSESSTFLLGLKKISFFWLRRVNKLKWLGPVLEGVEVNPSKWTQNPKGAALGAKERLLGNTCFCCQKRT